MTNTYVKFACGDVERANVLKIVDEEVCFQLPYGPYWTNISNLTFVIELDEKNGKKNQHRHRDPHR